MKSKLSVTNKSAVIVSVVIAVFIFVFASLVSNTQTSILSEAARSSGLSPNCYYRLNCAPRNTGYQSVFGCQPILVCPTPTVNPTRNILTCNDCLNNRSTILCFDNLRKASYCTSSYPGEISNISCVSCSKPSPTVYPRYTPTWYPKPTCPPYPTCPAGQVCPMPQMPIWCLPPTTYPEPTCYPPPPCLFSEPRCLLPEPIGGWCPPSPSIYPRPTCAPITCTLYCPNGFATDSNNCPVCKCAPTPSICLQVLTPARNITTRECRVFPTSCLPDGWIKDATCSSQPTAYPTRIWPTRYVCPTPPSCPGGQFIYGDPNPNSTYPCPIYTCIMQ